jgi:UDP-N-acetylglucosamine--N-acetylmuramyl-(pentapeptide) pyrophosphoryl-undecaprenol N-acetylglucosamine transferase
MPAFDSKLHVLIACGGTGGHLFPGIAVGETLSARGHEVTLLISEKKIDSLAASGHSELTFAKMPFLAMPRPWSPKMIPFLRGLWKGYNDCREIIRKHQIKVVLGMGGFTSLAPLVAGRKENCRTLIHESNAIPGKANRLNARFCNTVLTGLEACVPHFKHNDVRCVRSTAAAASPAVTCRSIDAPSITSSGGDTVVLPICATCCRSATGTTTSSTTEAGNSHSVRIASSPSPPRPDE